MTSTLVEIKHFPIANTFGFYDHYFIGLPELGIEIHPGKYEKGTHVPYGTTKFAHTSQKILFCVNCLKTLTNSSLQAHEFWYYPFVNCETLTKVLCKQVFPISYQFICSLCLLFTLISSITKVIFIFVTISIIILYIILSKYRYSYKTNYQCRHLVKHVSKYIQSTSKKDV